MHIERVRDAASDAVADYARLTDVPCAARTSRPTGSTSPSRPRSSVARSAPVTARARCSWRRSGWPASSRSLGAVRHPRAPRRPRAARGASPGTACIGAHSPPSSARRCPTPPCCSPSARRVVVLEDIVDHTNVGAIFRSVAALGADAVLVSPRCADPLYRRSVRVSMGTVFQVPWTRLPEWPEAARMLHAHGFSIAALALADGAVSLRDLAADPPERLALVFGAEGDGLSRHALEAADHVVTIPMAHGVDSLNVAAAAAVVLYALAVDPVPDEPRPRRAMSAGSTDAEAERAGVPPAAHRRVQRPRPGARAVHDRRRLLGERARRAHPRGAAGHHRPAARRGGAPAAQPAGLRHLRGGRGRVRRPPRRRRRAAPDADGEHHEGHHRARGARRELRSRRARAVPRSPTPRPTSTSTGTRSPRTAPWPRCVAGSTLTLRESLEAMLLPSGGNYSISIANWAFGSVDAFLERARAWLDEHGLVEHPPRRHQRALARRREHRRRHRRSSASSRSPIPRSPRSWRCSPSTSPNSAR